MNALKDVKLIEYSKPVDALNCITHAIGAALAVMGMVFLVKKSLILSDTVGVISCIIYSISLIAVYAISALYHGLPQGEAKRKARLFDHLAIPLLLAGTSTPCALITLRRVSTPNSILVITIAWFCAIFGIIAKLFFFEKLKAAVMAVYFTGGAIMLLSTVPLLENINKTGFLILVLGCVAYTVGALFCHGGIKRPWMHVIFHIFTVFGSAFHYFAIYAYELK
jgi:hemolysin III